MSGELIGTSVRVHIDIQARLDETMGPPGAEEISRTIEGRRMELLGLVTQLREKGFDVYNASLWVDHAR